MTHFATCSERDGRHLRLLVWGQIVLGLAMTAMIAFMAGEVILREPSRSVDTSKTATGESTAVPLENPEPAEEQKGPDWLKYLASGIIVAMFGGLFGGLLLWFVVLAVAPFVLAWNLTRLRRRSLCLAAAGIECTNVPFGTVVGVMTILVLSRESVRMHFLSAAQVGEAKREGTAKRAKRLRLSVLTTKIKDICDGFRSPTTLTRGLRLPLGCWE